MPISRKFEQKISNLIDNVKFVLSQGNQDKLFFSSVKKNEKFIIELNTKDQLFRRGIRRDDKKLRPLDKPYPIYSMSYRRRKERLGKFQGYVDLSVRGGYLKSYILEEDKSNVSVRITASPIILKRGFDLSKGLRKRYGEEIEGWTDQNFNKAVKAVAGTMRKKMVKIILNGN